ncbi:MAG: AAA domain-containing protein [Nitrospiraceae bacterium]
MKLIDLIQQYARALAEERDEAATRGLDAPIHASGGHKLATSGTLHLYRFDLPASAALAEDIPVTILPPGEQEPTEGFVVGRDNTTALVQAFDAFDLPPEPASIVPDASAFFDTASKRLADMAAKSDAYPLGPAERLAPWLSPETSRAELLARSPIATSAFSTLWDEDQATRQTKLTTLAIELARSNKRVLLISPNHRRADDILGAVARAMKAAGLPFKSLLCRYEMPVQVEAGGMTLPDLGFEAQMHQFYARSRADKAALRRKYERFRELTPLLAYKAQKQRDLDEVKLLEWRLLTQLSDVQRKIKEITATLTEYESLPIWKRLAMQAGGKNVASLGEYRTIYAAQVQGLLRELEIAKQRIDELSPEAAIPKDLRPEYDELKSDIKKLGGTKQIREMLAAEEDTNRQPFLQNKRLVATTAARVIADPLFGKVRFDVLIADEAPMIPAAYLLAAAGLARERIVLSGDPREVATAWKTNVTIRAR